MIHLDDKRFIIRLNETESTNHYLKERVKTERLPEGFVAVANYQSHGRGQQGNSWFSSKDKNLLFSFVIYPTSLPAVEQFILSRMISLSIKNTLDEYIDEIRIKWPNDIYWKELKIAGILIENNLQEKYIASSIIGVGLNVNEEMFPSDISNPVSLKQITGINHDADSLLQRIMNEFFTYYNLFKKGNTTEIEDEYMADLYRKNDYFWYKDAGGMFRAKIENVLPTGHLILRTWNDDQRRKYAFKEVEWINEEDTKTYKS